MEAYMFLLSLTISLFTIDPIFSASTRRDVEFLMTHCRCGKRMVKKNQLKNQSQELLVG